MKQKLTLQNVCPVPIHGKQPGEMFRVEASESGIPVDLLWRKRLAEKAVQIVVDPPKSASLVGASVEAATPKKKGKA